MPEPNSMVLFWITAFCCLGIATSENPGFQTRITAAGLNYANKEAIVQLSKSVRGQKINVPPGKAGPVSYSITDAEITEFSPPSSSSLKPIAGSGLKWSASDIGLAMSGRFRYSFRKIIKISDHGSFDISVSGVSFSVQVDLVSMPYTPLWCSTYSDSLIALIFLFLNGMDTNGRPSIRAGPCTSDIGSVSIKFHGRWAWAYNLFRRQFEKKIQRLLKEKMCILISHSLNTDAEKSLSLLKVTLGIGEMLELSYKLTRPPQFTSDYMETYHKGEIDWKSAPAPPPFRAPSLPPWKDTSRMMYLWVSDFMMNSLFYQAQQHNLLSYNLTAQDLPENAQGVLNTTCTSSLCIGNLIPELNKYPSCQLELQMRSTKMPQISVVNGSIETKMAGLIALYVRPMKTSSTLYFKPGEKENPVLGRLKSSTKTFGDFIFTMNANMTVTGQISVAEKVMHYKVTNMTITASLQNSTIPNVTERALNFLIKNAVERFIQPSIDFLGKKGIRLPLGKMSLKNAKLVLLKDAFVIATDLVYHTED
ncbi:Lipopolysaccharide-binding protein [Mizuhopecten yessoensis]|uniref:Lipopolysaccharide-binding protein n=1 Tax=Mizuhopecten yessoensis TaxID=6573 RepID=A0A210QHJ8_MIZYE|nr:Lipopolysaccharide-binding protein [Mizuhopecten yessoensis]